MTSLNVRKNSGFDQNLPETSSPLAKGVNESCGRGARVHGGAKGYTNISVSSTINERAHHFRGKKSWKIPFVIKNFMKSIFVSISICEKRLEKMPSPSWLRIGKMCKCRGGWSALQRLEHKNCRRETNAKLWLASMETRPSLRVLTFVCSNAKWWDGLEEI